MRRRRRAVAGLGLAVCLTGCSGSGAAPSATSTSSTTPSSPSSTATAGQACASAVGLLVSAVRANVATYDTPLHAGGTTGPKTTAATGPTTAPTGPTTAPTGPTTAPSAARPPDLGQAVADAREAIAINHCPSAQFRGDLERGLDGIQPSAPTARAVLARVRAALTGGVGQAAGTIPVAATDSLSAAVTTAAAGSTLVLAAGTYVLTEPLVLLDGVVIRGAGVGRTIITGRAADAAVIVASQSRVELSDLTLALDRGVPASGIVAGPDASLVLTRVHESGARFGAGGAGGAGVQMAGRAQEGSGRGTTLEVTDSTFADNAWAGLVLSGGHRVSVVRSTFTGNHQCGVCFLDSSTGSVERSTFTDDAVALGATGSARPTWLDNTVRGGVVGIQVDGAAAPTIDGVRITGPSRAAIIFSGHAAGAVTGARCTEVPFGIAVAATATPTLGTNACTLARAS